jgi:hypothetical protein
MPLIPGPGRQYFQTGYSKTDSDSQHVPITVIFPVVIREE